MSCICSVITKRPKSRQFTDKVFEDSSRTLLKTVHQQNFIMYLYSSDWKNALILTITWCNIIWRPIINLIKLICIFILLAFMTRGLKFSSVHSWNYFKVLRSSNSSGVHLTNHSSESIHIWTIGTLEGRLSFHDSSIQGPCPGVG